MTNGSCDQSPKIIDGQTNGVVDNSWQEWLLARKITYDGDSKLNQHNLGTAHTNVIMKRLTHILYSAIIVVLLCPGPVAATRRQPKKAMHLSPRAYVTHGLIRASNGMLRGILLPTHFWPMRHVAAAIAHGEPLAGLTEKQAVQTALNIHRQDNRSVVIGRLAPEFRDIWSVRAAEKQFIKLIEHIGAAHRDAAQSADQQANLANPFRAAIAFDPDSFGLALQGVPHPKRIALAQAAMLRVARVAKEKNVPIEIDVTALATTGITLKIAEQIVKQLHIPVRLAIAARYQTSDEILAKWTALAKKTNLKLGVRLVQGSYAQQVPGAISNRTERMAHYRTLITQALSQSDWLDIAVATQNEDIAQHAAREAKRLNGTYTLHVIRGVQPEFQKRHRDKISALYISYGSHAPLFGLAELLSASQDSD